MFFLALEDKSFGDALLEKTTICRRMQPTSNLPKEVCDDLATMMQNEYGLRALQIQICFLDAVKVAREVSMLHENQVDEKTLDAERKRILDAVAHPLKRHMVETIMANNGNIYCLHHYTVALLHHSFFLLHDPGRRRCAARSPTTGARWTSAPRRVRGWT